jgi:three-Cys-motif partner protein
MRGVVFLDPYGMEIDWSTVAAIATTKSLDLWYFFSLMGLYRQAANRAPAIDATKRAQPNRVLGTSEWEQAWYGPPMDRPTSLGKPKMQSAPRMSTRSNVTSSIGSNPSSRAAALDPLRFDNERPLPLASLFFAVSNPNQKAVAVASRIAKHILRRKRA